MLRKIRILLIILFLFLPLHVYAYSDYLVVGGENIGIKLKTKGVIVIGTYDDLNNNMKKGDIIISVNDKNINSIKELSDIISNNSVKTIDIGYIRDGKYKTTILKINNGKTGLYLKDTIVGIGTLTYIDPNTNIFGALGHEIIDSISGTIVTPIGGNIYESKVTDIRKSDFGNPGEKNANITSNNIGTIDKNSKKGIYGSYTSNFDDTNIYKVATNDEIKLGKAYILTELENNKIDKYEINIIKVDSKEDTKNIIFNVTDKRLLEIGGIVQGMSGSPIIQNNYIVGAVTHVVVDNPYKGYGILIKNMLEESEKKMN